MLLLGTQGVPRSSLVSGSDPCRAGDDRRGSPVYLLTAP